MISTRLTYQLYYSWTHTERVHVIGCAWFNETLYKGQALASYFSDITGETDFIQRINVLSGHFSVVVETDGHIYLAVDIIRTFPLFITEDNKHITISDEVHFKGGWNTAETAAFKKVYCTLENNTLLSDTRQLQAGEYAVIDSKEHAVRIKNHFRHSSDENKICRNNELEACEKTLVNRIIQYAGNRTIFIPLSGGYDSRYLLALLKKNNCTNVKCFIYGRKDSTDTIIAKKVAAILDIEWYFIEYTNELLNEYFSDEWATYSDMNHHYSSLPHEQDFFALHYLKKHHLLPQNAVVMNGFCQDIIAGSFLEPASSVNVSSHIEYKHDLKVETPAYDDSWNGYQEWLVKNRLSKFIVNSMRVYEYFGLDFYLPFWDKDWVDYWYSLSYKDKLNQSSYISYLFSGIFKEYGIDIPKSDSVHKRKSIYYLRKTIKSILPEKITRFIQQINSRNIQNDPNNSHYLYEELYKRLKNKPACKDFRINNIHAHYFLEKMEEKAEL